MITIEELRERLETPAKARVEWSKWIGSPTSWLALSLSAVTAYFTLIRQSDDIRVVVGERPLLYVDLVEKDRPRLGIQQLQQHLTIINSGNRTAAITSIALVVGRSFKGGEAQCQYESKPSKPFSLEYAFGGVVIKPGEIVSISLEHLDRGVDYALQRDNKGNTAVIHDAFLRVSRNTYVVACLWFLVITPDNVSQNARIPIYATELLSLGETLLVPEKASLFRRDTPTILISRRRTIFSE
jgi:hypothetical protein